MNACGLRIFKEYAIGILDLAQDLLLELFRNECDLQVARVSVVVVYSEVFAVISVKLCRIALFIQGQVDCSGNTARR